MRCGAINGTARINLCGNRVAVNRSTLLALVGAFIGLDRLKSLYALAQREGYRFYSYGDACLLFRP